MRKQQKVVIIGGGYTGVLTAIRLARRTRRRVEITLVSPADRFVERLRLHQIAAGQNLHEHRLSDLLAPTGVSLAVGLAEGIDLAGRTVRVGDERLAYDRLVIAVGSHADLTVVPGAPEHAWAVDDYESATHIASRLAALPAGSHVTVCGGGLTAIEVAAELAESYPSMRVRLVSAGRAGIDDGSESSPAHVDGDGAARS